MKNIFAPISLLFVLIFFACRPEPLIITLPDEPQQVVVFSQLIPNNVITVALTKTINSLDFSEEEGDTLNNDFVNSLLVENATVTVTFDGRTEELFEIVSGIYTSINTPQRPGVDYHLQIITETGDTISSTSTMLEQVRFDTISPVIERTEEDTTVYIQYEFTDPPGDNWYMINFYKRLDDEEADSTSLDLNNFFSRGINLETFTELLNDQTFENNTPSGMIEVPEIALTDSLVVTISNINEKYHQFLEARRRSGNFLSQLTREPIAFPTNVEGGLGFFNTHFPDVAAFDMKEW